MNVKKTVAKYIAARNEIEDTENKHKEELKSLFQKKMKLETKLTKHLLDTDATSIRTKAGTVVLSNRVSDRIDDWDAFIKFVRKHKFYHMLFKRVSSAAVTEYFAEEETIPPGVSRSTTATLSVRKR
jgi:hypothetical protein